MNRHAVKMCGDSVKVSFNINLAYYNITLHFFGLYCIEMTSKWVILFLAFAVCEFCGKGFESLNRHKCRCKSRSHQSSINSNTANNNASLNNIVNPDIINSRSISNAEYISCSYGKGCKELRGLKACQRWCRVIKSMSDNIVDNLENHYNKLHEDNNFDINVDNNLLDDTANESPSLTNGVKLPTSTNIWDIPITYFHSTSQISEKDTKETLNTLMKLFIITLKIILD